MNNRPKNYCPKNISGHSYHITVYENKVVIMDIGDNRKTIVKCHPDDTFDIGEAVRIGMDRLTMDDVIRVGDTVEVVDSGNSYCTMNNWDYVDKQYAIRYRYGVCPKNGTIGKVVRIVKDYQYIIQVKEENYLANEKFSNLRCYDCVYVMDKDGLKKIKDGRYE